MNPLIILKANFAVNLEKQGSSLQELEDALSHMDTEEGAKTASVLLKKAFLDKLNPLDIAKSGVGIGGAVVVGSGYGLASGLEQVDKKIEKDNKKLKIYQDKINLLHKLTKKVQQEHEHQG